MTDATECISSGQVVSMAELKIGPSEPEILLMPDNCFQFKEIESNGQVFKVPVALLVHDTTDEILRVIPLVTIEETGNMLYYKDGVYVHGGESRVEALLGSVLSFL